LDMTLFGITLLAIAVVVALARIVTHWIAGR
jgi:hypothetical protein